MFISILFVFILNQALIYYATAVQLLREVDFNKMCKTITGLIILSNILLSMLETIKLNAVLNF